MSFDLELSLFSPRQAEHITGIQMVRQRDLRRHGYLKQHHGHAKFDAIDLAQMMVLSAMMQRGIKPSAASGWAEICAVGIVQSALCDPNAWADFENAIWTMPGEQAPAEKAAWLSRGFSIQQAHKGRNLWRIQPGFFLIIWADGSELWADSVDTEISFLPPDDPKVSGPITVLDLRALAKVLITRAQAPLARVIAAKTSDQQTGGA